MIATRYLEPINFSLLKKYSTKSTPSCPRPKYDTGCTYCQPNDPELILKSPPESARNTAPLLNKIIVHLSANFDINNWPKKVEFFDVMRLMTKFGRGNGNLICMSSLPPKTPSNNDNDVEFLIFPDSKIVKFDKTNENTYSKLFEMINSSHLVTETTDIKTFDVSKPTVLICGHMQRDKRCGITGTLIYNEFNKVLEKENLQDEIDVGFVSHVGGHVYAGNLIILKPGKELIWYGMVKPENVQGILEKSILDDVVIDELSRY